MILLWFSLFTKELLLMRKETQARCRAKDIMAWLKLLLLGLQIAVFVAGWDLMQDNVRFFAQTSFLLFVIYSIILFWMHGTYESMRVDAVKLVHVMTGQLLSLLISDAMLLMLCTLAIRALPNLWIFSAVFAVQAIISLVWCKLAHRLYYSITPPKRVALVYDQEEDRHAFDEIFAFVHKYNVCKILPLKDFTPPYDDLLAELGDVESIFLTDVPQDVRSRLFAYATDHHLSIILKPAMNDVLISTARRRFEANMPTLKVGLGAAPLSVRIVKRAMDIMISGLLLILFSPVMAVVALMIKQEDHGPAFYRQKRLTMGGKVFEIIKFRSMRVDAEKDGVARLASENDDRITKVGRMIRATRLDELPQLWNIFKGDMSLVGPRPERPEIAAQYLKELPQFDARLQVKAGLTGYAQVNGKYNTTPEDKLQMDLMYISDMSIHQDIKLILQTVHTMLKKESTEGIETGKTTAMKN